MDKEKPYVTEYEKVLTAAKVAITEAAITQLEADARAKDEERIRRMRSDLAQIYEMWKAANPRLTSIGRSDILGLMEMAYAHGVGAKR